MTRKPALRAVSALAALLILAVLPACSLLGDAAGGPEVTAVFSRGTGLYPGSPVRVLGIDVGRITDVKNNAGVVKVTMRLDEGAKVPAGARATIVPLTLLGERYIQLGPAYTEGETLGDGDEIPLDRTSVPVEIDELLRGLQDFMGAIDPDDASSVVTNLAELLDGQGQDLNALIGNAAGTLDLLADKGDNLRAIVDSLGDLSETLRGRTESIETLLRNYDLVAQVLVDNKGDLDATIEQLDRAATELTDLLARHQDPLADDVAVLTATGRTLAANTDYLKSTLSSTVDLFAAADRAYDARTNSLALNNQLDPGITSEIIAGRFRDRIAGLCRRLAIDICANPASPLLNDLLELLPGLLGDLANGTGPQPAPSDPSVPTESPVPEPKEPPVAVPAPRVPSQDELLAAISDQLTGSLNQSQADLLRGLDADRLSALLGMDPMLLQVLPQLNAAQLDLLRKVEIAQLGQTLLDLSNQINPPQTRLDPILPPTTRPRTPTPTVPVGSGSISLDDMANTLIGGR